MSVSGFPSSPASALWPLAVAVKPPLASVPGPLANLADWRPVPGQDLRSAFYAVDRVSGQSVEVRILPWINTSTMKDQLGRQNRRMQVILPYASRACSELDLDSTPPKLVFKSEGACLEPILATLTAHQCICIAAQLFTLVERALLGGLYHNSLSASAIFVLPDDRIVVDYFSRFYSPTTCQLEANPEVDAADTVRLAKQLLSSPTELDNILTRLSGPQRGQLRSLLREELETGCELELFERWSNLLKPFDAGSASPEVANLNVEIAAKSSDPHPSTDDAAETTREIDVDLAGSATPHTSASDDQTGEVHIEPGSTATSTQSMPNCGETLGRFQLLTVLGKGGMGTVYRGIDLATDTEVAIKVLRPTGSDIGQAIRRFNKEARLLQSVSNEYVTQLYDSGYDRGYHFLAMEFVDGTNLKEWMKSRMPLDEVTALSIVADVARALVDAHEQEIVHRDIKPENVLLSRLNASDVRAIELDLSSFRIKLSDFGIARTIEQSASLDLTRAGSILGTPTYMAPEQCKGTVAVSPASDIYALGVTLYYLLCGQPPFEAEDPLKLAAMHCFDPPVDIRKRNPHVSMSTATLLDAMLAKQPMYRPADAAQLVCQIEQLLRGEANDAALHPLLPPRANRLWERVFTWELKSSPEELWQYVSNTDRLNRAAGFQAVSYRSEKHPVLGLRKFGTIRLAGMKIEWEEHPFEWIEGKRMGVLREFSSGPFRWFLSLVELAPTANGGTLLKQTLQIEPRNWLGRYIAAFEAGWKGGRALDRVYRRIDWSLQQEQKNSQQDPFEPGEALSTSIAKRIEQRMDRMIEMGVSLTTASQLSEFLEQSAPQVLSQMRPVELADRLKLPSEEIIDACLVAAHCGLLQMRWDILCPTCRAPANTVEILSQIEQHQTCEACDTEFQTSIANAIELVFRAHPEIRHVDDNQYCAGGPNHSPHVVSQLRLQAGERMEVTVPLKTGDYLLRGMGLRQAVALRVRSQAAPSSLDLRLSQLGTLRDTRIVRAGGVRFAITNDLPGPQLVRLERAIERANVVTAAVASALPRFRELFPNQVFRKDKAIAADELTLVAARIVTTEQLYLERGDAGAYVILRQALSIIEDCMCAYRGAVIKTGGDSLLASFQDSAQATVACLAISQRLREQSELSKLVIATAVHRGSLLVATQNGRLDYFGSTARQVQSLCDQLEQGVALTDSIFTDAAVQTALSASNIALRSLHRSFNLPGSPQRLVQHLEIDDRNPS